MNLESIRSRYLRRGFTVDLISAIPVDAIVFTVISNPSEHARWLRLLGLLRMLRLFRLSEKYYLLKPLEVSRYANLFRLVRLMATWMFLTHLTACIFWDVISHQPESVQQVMSLLLLLLLLL